MAVEATPPLRTMRLSFLFPSVRRRLRVSPRMEEADPAPPKFELKKGLCYMVKEERPATAFRVFADQITHPDPVTQCAQGLCLTRTPPATLREGYGLKRTPILWVGEQPPAPDIQAANDCEEILYVLAKFLKQCPNPTIVLDCLEYLCQTTDFRQTLKFIYHVKELTLKHNGRFIFSVNPRSFPDPQLSLLEKEMEPLAANGPTAPR